MGRFGSTPIHFVADEGIRLAGDSWGDRARLPVVLLHGGGQTRHAWARAGEELAALGWWAIALDLRGHGESEWSKKAGYLLDDFASDVASVVRALERPPVLVGASLGGLASLVALGESRWGVRGSGLVLVDVAARLETGGTDRIKTFMLAHPEGFASLEAAADAVHNYLSHRRRPVDPSSLQKNLRLHPDGRYRWHWDPKFMTGVIPEQARLEAAASNLDVPTLLIRGMSSDVLSMEGVREFMEHAPHAVFENVADAEHTVAGDRNDVFNRVVARFLQRTVLDPAPC